MSDPEAVIHPEEITDGDHFSRYLLQAPRYFKDDQECQRRDSRQEPIIVSRIEEPDRHHQDRYDGEIKLQALIEFSAPEGIILLFRLSQEIKGLPQ